MNAKRFDPAKTLRRLLGRGGRTARPRRPRLRLDTSSSAVYAVGDVHGCLDELLALERLIGTDAEQLPPCPRLIVMLGDYVDRGPASAQVLDHLTEPPPLGFERVCLAGNHDLMMLDFLEGRCELSAWLAMGGEATLASYGIDVSGLGRARFRRQVEDAVRQSIPAAHLAFLRGLPVLLESPKFLFVHAGIRPGLPLAGQSDNDLVTIRSAFFDHAALLERYVVHGHTPVARPTLEGRRLNLDTAAFSTGRLTCARLWNKKARFITT
ncbi:metallophosphoesterase family protein [Mesorhizobium xinjiangense]|uniref:metallophosphoesterase family protein n=1 Tax=Mesorhizobium xinjiangense TaxID=2678685 RepID=UPI0012EED26B|nr:metallophosphoesterase family protein [Mesorhizobium xinjiangense]